MDAVHPASLLAASVLLAFAATWELAGALDGAVAGRLRSALAALSGGRFRSLGDLARRLGVSRRIERAGLGGRIQPAMALAAKALGATLGLMAALAVAPALPGRLPVLCVGILLAAGFLAPDAALERAARRRVARIAAALPDALDLVAVGAASGRSPGRLFGEVASGSAGPLADELAVAVAEIECGASERRAVEALRERLPGMEVGALAAALERSRQYGAPLAEQLHEQASALRLEERRRIDERAARAAPKIQLVVALVLVPSVLLMILAAAIGHSDALLAGL